MPDTVMPKREHHDMLGTTLALEMVLPKLDLAAVRTRSDRFMTSPEEEMTN